MTDVQQAVPVAQEKRGDIRHNIIRQLGDDPHADRIILPGTDWDIVLEALRTDATQTREAEDPAKIALDAYNQGYRDGCEDSGAEADMESARDGWHDWLHDCEALKLDDAAFNARDAA